ncbi:DUF2849 domain-containing protein [Prosthecomicrobium sp. N25]|uniref:DUF2849 domain-containing protein n=1 Tax=Prosthecomicrobium sp. N25 TaxID=3129254 RepID=UPI003078463F
MPDAVITANRLADGRVVWLTADRAWSTDVSAAAVVADKVTLEAALAAAAAAVAARIVVDPYATDVDVGGAGIVPKSLRERIRAKGPTVPSDFPSERRPA